MAASIFERCGGFGSVSKIVMSFYNKALDTDVIGDFFEDIDMQTLIDPQTKFISSAMGGPASYSNDILRQVHGGLKIDVVAFNEAISLLQQTMEEFELDPEDIVTVFEDIRNRAQYIISV